MSQFRLRGQQGNPDVLKQRLIKWRQAGEKALASQFEVDVEGYPDLGLKFTNVQYPAMKRALVESFGPMGTQSNQQGALENYGTCTAQIVETITGDTLRTLRQLVRDGVVIDAIQIRQTPESAGGKAVGGVELQDCWIEVDSSDFANDSVTEILKLPITIHFTWQEEI